MPSPTDTPTDTPPTLTPTETPTDTPPTPTPTNTPVISIDIEANERQSVLPGQQVIYTHVVSNTGNTTDTVTLTAPPILTTTTSLIAPNPLVNLAPGASRTVVLTLTTPASTNAGISFNTPVTANSNLGASDSVVDTTILITSSIQLNAAAGDGLVSLGWQITSSSVISYELEYSVAGGPWNVLTTTATTRAYHTGIGNDLPYAYQVKAYDSVGLIGYSNVANAIPGVITTTTVNCTIPPTATISIGPPGDCVTVLTGIDAVNQLQNTGLILVFPGSSVILDYGSETRAGIIDGPGFDLAYFAQPVDTVPGVALAFADIALSPDGTNWTTVFAWDGVAGGTGNSNVASFATDGNGEAEYEVIAATSLFSEPNEVSPTDTDPQWNTGISIDIAPVLEAGVHYRFIRFSSPAAATGNNQLDAIYRIN